MVSIILNRVKYPHNLAGAIRAGACFGADSVYWTGSRFHFADGERLPREERLKGYSHVQVKETERPFDLLSADVVPICVELLPSAMPLTLFEHPAKACYVFGPEDGHVCQSFRGLCHHFIYIPAKHCLNLVAAMNVVLAHRLMQRQLDGFEPLTGSPLDVLAEPRGLIAVPGWDGK